MNCSRREWVLWRWQVPFLFPGVLKPRLEGFFGVVVEA
jgi:hypothetical protein